MTGLISVNNTITSPDQAAIPAMDRGFLFGDNVFEVLVGFGEQILDIPQHLTRLRASASDTGIEIPWSDEELSFELLEMARQTKFQKTNYRLVVTRGSGSGIAVPEGITPNKIVYAFPAKTEPETLFTKGLSLKRRKLPFTERGAHAKTGNYLRSIVAMKKSRGEGYDDVLWSNADDELTEASTANIFMIGRQGDLVEIATPAVSSGILKGITRETIIGLLTRAQIRSEEKIIYVDEIARFDEAFVCSTVRGLIPVQRIDTHVLHTCRKNSVFRHIQRLYGTWAETQLGYRINWNTGLPDERQ